MYTYIQHILVDFKYIGRKRLRNTGITSVHALELKHLIECTKSWLNIVKLLNCNNLGRFNSLLFYSSRNVWDYVSLHIMS